MSDNIFAVMPLGFPWQTIDPFLFCVHHRDDYPTGNEDMGPDRALLRGRNIGMDFTIRDGWRMYHGQRVPGFPRHPHRGFETITVARNGYIDHSDSLGATARFGNGDVQWMTAGQGIEHSEMFPLVNRDKPNPTELFQIWLNLPAKDKMVEAYFTMFWNPTVPRTSHTDSAGRKTDLRIIAGTLGEHIPPEPPPNSWASHAESDVAVWTLKMESNAGWTIPPAAADTNRVLYFFEGTTLTVDGQSIDVGHAVQVRPDQSLVLENGDGAGEVLVLQGRPIGDPVVHHGPFVMNSQNEIRQAIQDYHSKGFGGWPWQSDGPVHSRDDGRFAIHADGKREQPDE